ncbi:MAG: hypothetical protein LBQ60_17455 [Bacteroidales bacterium]|nr:hypothetical protein [Bacteroidales bacterium]
MKKIIQITLFLFVTFSIANGQTRLQVKEIKSKNYYTHIPTQLEFPKSIFSDFQRKNIHSFDKENKNISVTYEKNVNGEKTTFSLYLYPAGDAYEGRLREEYQNSIQSVAAMQNKGLYATQFAMRHVGAKYVCNGFKTIFTDEQKDLSQLTIFESGTWFYKLRITTNRSDTAFMLSLEKEILQKFDPTSLTDLNQLNEKISVYFSKLAFGDSLLLGSVMGSAFRKIDWVMENVKENERATGFPDLYLNLHVEGLKAFMEFQHRVTTTKSEFTENYLKELQLISDADFLPEFVMEQFEMILIIPENMPDKYDEYLKWKIGNNISINLSQKFYVLSFDVKE